MPTVQQSKATNKLRHRGPVLAKHPRRSAEVSANSDVTEAVRAALLLLTPDDLRSLARKLAKAIDHVIGSREDEILELEHFVDALREIRSVRCILEMYAQSLDGAQ